MTPEDQKHYENFFEMFATKGWKQLVEQCEEEKGRYTIAEMENIDQLRYAQGMISVLDNTIGLEDRVRSNYDKIIEDEKEDDSE